MIWNKDTFKIRLCSLAHPHGANCQFNLVEVEGAVSSDGVFGIWQYDNGKWGLTNLASGYSLHVYKQKKLAKEAAERVAGMLAWDLITSPEDLKTENNVEAVMRELGR